MLSPAQLSILRNLLQGLPTLGFNQQRKAWPLDEVKYLCRPYDRSTGYFDDATGDEALRRLLLEPKLMSRSPDGLWCKLTDYGRALYEETEAQQREWEGTPIIPLDDAEKDQIVIRPGEVFRGKYFVMDVLKRARAEIRLHDNFCTHELLAWLHSVSASVVIHILTSPRGVKQDPAFESMYRAFQQERNTSEVRVTEDVHDRKIIIDDREAFGVGESLKDFGRKGTTIVRLRPAADHIAQFDAIWSGARPL